MNDANREPFSKEKCAQSAFLIIAGVGDNQEVLSVGADERAIVYGFDICTCAAGLIQLHFEGALAASNHIGSLKTAAAEDVNVAHDFKFPLRGGVGEDVDVDVDTTTNGVVSVYYTIESVGT